MKVESCAERICGLWVLKAVQQLLHDWCHKFPVLSHECFVSGYFSFPLSRHRSIQSSVSRKELSLQLALFFLSIFNDRDIPACFSNSTDHCEIVVNNCFFNHYLVEALKPGICLFLSVYLNKKICFMQILWCLWKWLYLPEENTLEQHTSRRVSQLGKVPLSEIKVSLQLPISKPINVDMQHTRPLL